MADQLGPTIVLGRPETVGSSRVVRVQDRSGSRWYAKRLTKRWRYDAEVTGYRLWSSSPGVLDLRAACDECQCLLLPEAPGRQPSGQSRPALRAAGALLRDLHAHQAPADWSSGWRNLAVHDTERRLRHLARAGVRVDVGMVRHHTAALVRTDLPEVVTHGDYQPHNWRWRRGRLVVFDFACAALRPAAYDVGRLYYAACWGRPELARVLLGGYGRDLTDDERAFVTAMLPWRAVVAISLGLRHDRPEMVRHGLTVLAHRAASERLAFDYR